ITLPHMRHVYAKHPEQSIRLLRGNLAQAPQEALHRIVRLRHTAVMDAVGVGAAKNGQYADIRTIQMLQEEHLKFDRVLDRMAVVLHDRGRFGGKLIDQVQIGDCLSKRSSEALAGEAETVRLAVM